MVSTFKYRFSGTFGSLAADLAVEYRAPDSSEGFRLQVYRNVWLTLPNEVNWRDAAWLSFGLSVHAPDLSAAHPDGLIIKITSLSFPLAHFRSEVAALAMDGWVREEFGLPDRGLHAVSREGGEGYIFHLGEHSDLFSDDDYR